MDKPRRSRNRPPSGAFTIYGANITPGSIIWLPPRDKIQDYELGNEAQTNEGCFEHPVVVLRINKLKDEATVLIITSFNNVPLHIKHRSKPKRLKYLPIAPSPSHPDHGLLLEIEGELLFRNSYVGIGEAMIFGTGVFRHFGSRKLTTTSYQTLLERTAGIKESNFAPITPVVIPRVEPTPPLIASYAQWNQYSPVENVNIWNNRTPESHHNALPTANYSLYARTQPQPAYSALPTANYSVYARTQPQPAYSAPPRHPAYGDPIHHDRNSYGTIAQQPTRQPQNLPTSNYPEARNTDNDGSSVSVVIIIFVIGLLYFGAKSLGYLG